MRRAVLVNGIPASGKSTVARLIAERHGWPILTLDAVKEPFFGELGTGDREWNRALGRASYRAMFNLIADFPPGGTTIIDAWFGFQPREVLERHLAHARITQVLEVWCHAPPEVIGARYAARVDTRPPGHPGMEYVPELIALARRAGPLGGFARFEVDTSLALDGVGLADWVGREWKDANVAQ